MAKKMVGWVVTVVGTVIVIMHTAKATTIDIAVSDLTTVNSMNTAEVNMNSQGEGGFSGGVNIGREERGCRRKNGQVR